MSKSLTIEEVLALSKKKDTPKPKPKDGLSLIKNRLGPYIVQQYGPLRKYNKTMRCESTGYIDDAGNHIVVPGGKGCLAPTLHKLQNVPLCLTHAAMRMNSMLIERGVDE